jgi:hypothetical protein
MKLLDIMRDAIRVRHYSIWTEEDDINWIRCFGGGLRLWGCLRLGVKGLDFEHRAFTVRD